MASTRSGRKGSVTRGIGADTGPQAAPGREALRLLAALARTGAYAFHGPAGGLVARREAGGVSLGGGAFPDAAGAALVADDLARWEGTAGQPVLRITEPGRARLARSEGGDHPFAAQHREETRAAGPDGEPVRINAAESPLDWLRRRQGGGGLIDEAGFAAGERLRRDLTLAAMLPAVTARWDPVPSEGRGGRDPGSATERTIAARQRVRRALDGVGPDFAGLLVDVCGFLKGLQQVEAERGWPPRAGKVVLALALGRLAAHYGLKAEAAGPDRSRGIAAWREAG